MCDTFLIHWVQSREEFDQLYFNQETSTATGDYHLEIYHGLCTGEGPENYVPMLQATAPMQENCIDGSLEFHGCDTEHADPISTELRTGLNLAVNIDYPRQCEVFTAGPGRTTGAEITFSGDAEIYGAAVADTSMVFVIDRSGSTCDNPNQGCASDENYDLQFDDTLDCEIAAVLDLVSKVRDEGTVSHIGLVSFSHKLGLDIDTATIELPLTDINIPTSSTLHAIENSIRDVNCGGATNYAAAVEKACEVMESSTTALNIVIFISDGLPTRGGSPAAYCNNEAIFHTIALGDKASCVNDDGTGLQEISDATKGLCQEVEKIADIRPILKQISDVKFLSLQGSEHANEDSINWGCSDVPDFMNTLGMTCTQVVAYQSCGTFVGQSFADVHGETGDSACCACGGGIYLSVGNLETVENPNYETHPESQLTTGYEHTAVMQAGTHQVCTTVVGIAGGIPGANVQCRNILVCPNPADY